MNQNGSPNGKPNKDKNSTDFEMLIVLAMVCGTILGVVWIIWG